MRGLTFIALHLSTSALLFAGDLTLTGLARHRGKAYAYLSSGKSGESFNLRLGQELANLKLESIDFIKGEAVVVSGEERLILALERRSKESTSGSPAGLPNNLPPTSAPLPGFRQHGPPGGFPRHPGAVPIGVNPNSNYNPNALTAPPPRTLAEAQAQNPEAAYTEGAAEMTVTTPGTMTSPSPIPPNANPAGVPAVPAPQQKIPVAVGVISPDDPSPEPPEPVDH